MVQPKLNFKSGYWNRQRIENGLRRYARDFFAGGENNLPLTLYAYRRAIPEPERRRLLKNKYYPPFLAVLRHYESLFDAWRALRLPVKNRRPKTVAAEIAGHVFGWLTAVEYARSAPGSGRIWKCRCRCGKICFVAVKNLLRGRQVSCGCYRRRVLSKIAGGKIALDLRGKKFGRLAPLRIIGKRGSENLWECDCDCGSRANVPTSSLTRRGVRSCGCLRDEAGRERFTKIWETKRLLEKQPEGNSNVEIS